MSDAVAETLAKNLDFLKDRCATDSFQLIKDATPGNLLITEGECSPFVYHAIKDNQKFLIHSKRDPHREAARQIGKWLSKDGYDLDGMVVVFGMGGLFHLGVLADLLQEGASLFIVDLNPSACKVVLAHHDLSDLQKPGIEVTFSFSTDIEKIRREFRYYLKKRAKFKVSFFVHPGVRRVYSRGYDELFETLRIEVRREALDRHIVASLGDEWLQHALMNLPTIVSSANIACLKNLFPETSAIVVAAGPSLNDAIPVIRANIGKALIIAVGTALKPLEANGIVPDFVVAVDSDPFTLKQFQGISVERASLLCAHSVYPKIPKMFSGRTFFLSTSNLPGFNRWLKQIDALPDRLEVGGTVALTAMDAAVYMGCQRLFIVGLDLAYKKDGTTHASYSMYEDVDNREKKYDSRGLLRIPGNYDEFVETNRQFATYVSIVETYVDDLKKRQGVEFYNVTLGGAKIRGLDLICPEDMEGMEFTGPGIKVPSALREKSSDDRLVEFIETTREKFSEIIGKTSSAIKICDILSEESTDLRRSKSLMAELSQLDIAIKSDELAISLINDALRALYMDICSVENNSTQAGSESFALEVSKKLYTHLKGATEWIDGLAHGAACEIIKRRNK